MPAVVLRGKIVADAIKAEVAADVIEIKSKHHAAPCLVVVRIGEDPASAVYVRSKVKAAEEVGITSEHIHLNLDTPQQRIIDIVGDLNARDDVDGILLQLPLPKHIDEAKVLELIDPNKDVDGFHPINAGHLMQGSRALIPCTPAGVIQILKRSGIDIAGKNAVIVGRSNIVGKPMAMLLLHENATVTICHSRTSNLADVCSKADILVAAIGQAGVITSEHIGDGATVIDVGINNVTDRKAAKGLFAPEDLERRLATIEKRGFTLVGDVNPRDAMEKAGHYTPVPGGVGLLTVAMLMNNTVAAAKWRRGI